jgi:hypothetical protein
VACVTLQAQLHDKFSAGNMRATTFARRCQVSLLALFVGIAALAGMYVAGLSRPTLLSFGTRQQQSRHAQNGTPHLLYSEAPCLPADWPAGVVNPDIFIVGHSKTGSTYIHALLTQHPNVVEASKKEINFFPATGIANPMQPYAQYFPKRVASNPNATSIDASVGYVVDPLVRDTLRLTFPCAKIVFLMRDPTARWWSGYNFVQRRCNTAPGKKKKNCQPVSLEEHYARQIQGARRAFQQVGFTKEVQESGVSFFSLQRQQLPIDSIPTKALLTGMYYSRIMEWLEVWPRSQVLLVNMEDYFDPATLNDRMRVFTDFVGLPPHKFEPIPPELPAHNSNHTAPGDYGLLPEPYNSNIREFYEPDLKLLKEHFGISFKAPDRSGAS